MLYISEPLELHQVDKDNNCSYDKISLVIIKNQTNEQKLKLTFLNEFSKP